MYGKGKGKGGVGGAGGGSARDRERRDRAREADALVRQQEHPLFTNLGSRNVPRKRSGR